ncbi:sensor histidine kinase [Tabrizicola caldifontis]|uniref:sensor histidine kinase n=1 Tax=Tabrizicola caldifontis TaxID=2528036 RepID=UPI0010804445|nr:ATP-binding protein [Rhodobacter sp. YIM 73028]
MKAPRSLQGRLGLWLGLVLTALWVAAASVTALIARGEIEQVFDAALQETAQRILPLAVVDILNREEAGISQRLAAIREHDEYFTCIVRDDQGRILLQSHAADPTVFPAWDGAGFRSTATHRLYNDEAVQGTIRITVAEPLAHRAIVAWDIQMGLGLPLLVVLPVALIAIVMAVRASLAPLRKFRDRLAARGASDLSPVASTDLPSELAPLAETMNSLLARLDAAFESERSFAANAAHELRTPLAGAIAQAQRLQAEMRDADARARAGEIEANLKRLTRLAERLLQLARAEGGRLRRGFVADVRPVARLIVDELARVGGPGCIRLTLPATAVLTDLDPDAFAILLRNLIENALRHGRADCPVDVVLSGDGTLIVANEGPVVPADDLARLTQRFERAKSGATGSGLGLAIVRSIAERTGSSFEIRSPRAGGDSGFEAIYRIPDVRPERSRNAQE